MKKHILLTFFVFLQFILNAQVIPEEIVTRITNSPYIFEGKVLRSDAYFTQDQSMIYTSSTIEIFKIFKGNLSCGTVEVLTLGGCVGDICLDISHALKLKEGMLGVFMCSETQKENPLIDYYSETNALKLDFPYDIQGYIKYFGDDFNKQVVDYQYSLDSLAQVYDLIDLYTQLNYVDCHGSSPLAPYEAQAKSRKEHKEHDEDIKQYVNALSISSATNLLNSADTNIVFTMMNAQLTGTNPKYFEFDLGMSDNISGIYFLNAFPRFIYDTLTFVPNIDSIQKLWINNSPIMSDTSTYNNFISRDLSRNMFTIDITSKNSGSLNLVDIPSVPTPMVHIKMEVNNCSHSGYIIQTRGSGYYEPRYSLSQVATVPRVLYDTLDLSSYLYFSGCGNVQIFSVIPPVVSAGTNDTVTITGANFGIPRGNVFLKESDQGGAYFINLDSSDYNWSDTLIKFVMPGIVDSVQQVLNQKFGVPGTGPIKIQTANGDSAECFIKVRFSLTTRLDGTLKSPVTPFDFSPFNRDGVKFSFDTSFTNHPERMTVFLKAMHDWVCLADMHFEAGDTIIADTIPSSALDTFSIVKFDTLPSGIPAWTQMWDIKRGNCGRFYWLPDITFNSLYIPTFWCDTSNCDTLPIGMRDMYAVAIHELGHAHGINHQNDESKIMYYATFHNNTTPILPQNRQIYLSSDTPADSAAHNVMSRALDPNISNCLTPVFGGNAITPIHLTDCQHVHRTMSCWIGIDELNQYSNFKIYPNPTNSKVTIDLEERVDETISIIVLDIAGRNLTNIPYIISKGDSSLDIDLSDLNPGVYFIKFDSNHSTGGSMIIKR